MHLQHNEEAFFHCCEMVLGELLGTGAFCEVHEVYDVRLLSRKEQDDYKCQTEENEQRKRENIYQTCHDEMGSSRYVVKRLRPNLAMDRSYKIFTHAADDCLKEFDILSRMSHPNVVRMWGSSVSGRNSNNDDKDYRKMVEENNPENFFIVLEKLEETLTQRILSWIVTKKRITKERNGSISDSSSTALPPFYVEKLRYARDIASALAHIHDHGMVFR